MSSKILQTFNASLTTTNCQIKKNRPFLVHIGQKYLEVIVPLTLDTSVGDGQELVIAARIVEELFAD